VIQKSQGFENIVLLNVFKNSKSELKKHKNRVRSCLKNQPVCMCQIPSC